MKLNTFFSKSFLKTILSIIVILFLSNLNISASSKKIARNINFSVFPEGLSESNPNRLVNKYAKRILKGKRKCDTVNSLIIIIDALSHPELKEKFRKLGVKAVKAAYPNSLAKLKRQIISLNQKVKNITPKQAYKNYHQILLYFNTRVHLVKKLSKAGLSIQEDENLLQSNMKTYILKHRNAKENYVKWCYEKAKKLLNDKTSNIGHYRAAYLYLKTAIELNPNHKEAKDLNKKAYNLAVVRVLIEPTSYVENSDNEQAAKYIDSYINQRLRFYLKSNSEFLEVGTNIKHPTNRIQIHVDSVKVKKGKAKPNSKNFVKEITENGRSSKITASATIYKKMLSSYIDGKITLKDQRDDVILSNDKAFGYFHWSHSFMKYTGNKSALSGTFKSHSNRLKDKPYIDRNIAIKMAASNFNNNELEKLLKSLKNLID